MSEDPIVEGSAIMTVSLVLSIAIREDSGVATLPLLQPGQSR